MFTREPTKAATALATKRNALAEASYRNAEVLQAMGMAPQLGAHWSEVNVKFLETHQRATDVAGALGAISKIMRMTLQSAMLGIGALLVIQQEATAGVMIAASIIVARALAPVDLAIANWRGFVACRQSWRRLNELLENMPADEAQLALPKPVSSFSAEGISVVPPGDTRMVVQDVGFRLAKGNALGVIGPSASGKSCLVRALVGIWHPVRGTVRLDGATLEQWSASAIGGHIGYLPQDVELFSGTVSQNRQFEIRRAAREGQRAQLKERITQLREEMHGSESQIESRKKQSAWIAKELVGVNDLWSKNLIPYTRVTALEREKERLEGERGALMAAIAQAKGKITETELQILQIDQEMRSEVGRDLADIRGKTAELVEKKVAAEDQLKRVDIRAPLDGTVFQMSVHTVGGVITTGEVLMLIVPQADALEVEVKVQPQDIDQIRLGQAASLRFTAFNQRTTPELNGEVSRISADVTEDQKTGVRYYTVRIAIPASEIARLEGQKIVPGMPVESFIQTSPRTVMSYLIRPLHDQISRAFREK
jgi:HlyD family type I secretion membrane fusion protein